jgi:hypothetical protein
MCNQCFPEDGTLQRGHSQLCRPRARGSCVLKIVRKFRPKRALTRFGQKDALWSVPGAIGDLKLHGMSRLGSETSWPCGCSVPVCVQQMPNKYRLSADLVPTEDRYCQVTKYSEKNDSLIIGGG